MALAELRVGERVLALAQGDITAFAADAIVNAANSALAGGGGVDGVIHRAGGREIMAELRGRYSGCPTGSAVATGAGAGETELLASAYRAALRLGDEHGARTTAFPAISAGIYGYPLREAATIALSTVRDHLAGETILERATFVLFSADTFAGFAEVLGATVIAEAGVPRRVRP